MKKPPVYQLDYYTSGSFKGEKLGSNLFVFWQSSVFDYFYLSELSKDG